MVDELVVTLPLLDLWTSENASKLMIAAASCRLPAYFYASPPPFAVSLANADGTEVARYDGVWEQLGTTWESELNILAFYVTFRAGKHITTACVLADAMV